MAASPIEPAVRTRNPDFAKLWVGQGISMIGSQVTYLALPITAAVTLSATPLQMGILSAVGSAPALLFGLLAGVWVDHHKRRPILIGSDIGRALVLAIIPLSALLGMLRVEVMYVVGFLAGGFGLFFNVAYRSYLPGLVGRDQLVKANSQLELSNSVAEIIGPGAAGGLVQLIGAPFAIAVDAFSFIISSFSIGLIRTPEPPLKPVEGGTDLGNEIKDGLRLVFGERSLRALAGCIGSISLFNAIFEAVQILFLTRQLGLSAAWLGVIFACGSVGFLLGAVIADRLTRRLGLGRCLVLGVLVIGASDMLLPLAGRLSILWLIIGVLVLAELFFGMGLTVFQIGQVSLRQSLTPDHLQGRMNATLSMLTWGIVPLGGLLGGVLGQVLGLSPTLLLAAFGEMLAVFWLVFSPVRMIRHTGGV
ncbi:MAG: MFS transporter [Anaerolineales bacterium]